MPSKSEFVLSVWKTKTIQFGQRILRVPFVAAPLGCPLCPVEAMVKLLHCTPYRPELPLFLYYKGSELAWWTHTSFSERLRDVLDMCGYDSKLYSCHSFRRGGASFGFELQMSMIDIKQRGDWASNAVENYIFVSKSQVNSVAARLSRGAAQRTNEFLH